MSRSARAWLPRALAAAAVVAASLVLALGVLPSADARTGAGMPSRRAPAPVPADPVAARPHTSDVAGSRDLFVVGDSLTVGTEPWLGAQLHRAGWRMTGVDARVGRGVPEGLAVLRAHAARLPGTVVVALGTNNFGAGPSEVAGWLRSAREIAGGRRLVWVNVCLDDTVAPRLHAFRQVDAALARYAPRFGVELADWCAFAARHGIRPGPDGIHYSGAGYRERARFYALTVAGDVPS